MSLNVHAAALWLGIAASAAAVYFPIHSELKADHDDQTKQAVERQRRVDALNERLSAIDRHLQFIDETLPEREKDLARRIFAQVQQQQATYDKIARDTTSMEDAVRGTAKVAAKPKPLERLELPAVSADAPKAQ